MEIIDHRLSTASQCASPFFDARPANEISLLVIHNISLPAGVFGAPWVDCLFTGQWPENTPEVLNAVRTLRVSAHLFIRRNGQVFQYVAFDKRAWHAGVSCYHGRSACNDFSIGIELEGTDDLPYESAQYQHLIEVTKLLLKHYPDLQKDAIVGHSDIAPGRKTDPGNSFDWDFFKRHL
jgi:AmpD protein